jgi:hypothetical protein
LSYYQVAVFPTGTPITGEKYAIRLLLKFVAVIYLVAASESVTYKVL